MNVIVSSIALLFIYLIVLAGILAWVLRPGKKMTTPRRVATLATAIPPVVPGILAVFFEALLHQNISNTCVFVVFGLIGAAILASASFAFTRKYEIARGIGFGVCITVIVAIMEFGLLEWLGGV